MESPPTGGWGYDNFPLTAAYARRTGLEYLGMTGKFHGTWGEFGGLKHPNALRYECAAMIAAGARCSIGDQLHPCGKLDKSTYDLIGTAYREVREKEAYCRSAVNRSDIAVISGAACDIPGGGDFDIGVSRMLLESHYLFDVLHPGMDFSGCKLVIFPEKFTMDEAMLNRVKEFVSAGGKVLFSGECVKDIPLDFGAETGAMNELNPTYILPAPQFRPEFVSTPVVIYGANLKLKVTSGLSTGEVYEPYYNRALGHFCSHQHTPNHTEASGYAAGVINGGIAALAHPVFSIYRGNGSAVLREFADKVIGSLLGEQRSLTVNLPSVARVTLTADAENGREIVHLLYAPLTKRGSDVEIIEDLIPLHDTEVSVRTLKPVKKAVLAPQGIEIPFTSTGNRIKFKVDAFTCHQMIVLEY